ncbi:MAG: hypothetical protein PVH42_11595 [Desulfobacterales bacterium]|jgi:hypothetical protein
MIDYIKDWRIWVLAIVVLIILRFPVFGEEIKVEPEKKRSDNIEFKLNGVNFKWKMDQFEMKWKAEDRFDIRQKLIADDINEYRTMVLFTIKF